MMEPTEKSPVLGSVDTIHRGKHMPASLQSSVERNGGWTVEYNHYHAIANSSMGIKHNQIILNILSCISDS